METVGRALVVLCRDVFRPLIEADGGKLHIVFVSYDKLVLHLGGSCSGCPGAPITVRSLIEPEVHAIDPGIRVVVTSGAKTPDDAMLVTADSSLDELETYCGCSPSSRY